MTERNNTKEMKISDIPSTPNKREDHEDYKIIAVVIKTIFNKVTEK